MEPINVSELPEYVVANYLTDEEQIKLYLAEVAKQDDAKLWARALDNVAHTRKRWNLPAPGITIGSMAGRFTVPDDFDAPLSDDELRAVEGMLPPPTTTEDMIDQMGKAMDRMAKDEAERLKVAKRLF